ncbi:MAG: [NiFe]-hydrogenase assembly chaperone HybE [Gammaproteobacteria bacterium]|nr:[NiFe]-hydrogenase assembly chaperone HybE [Gammaproteobacteria bacterium]
MSISVQQLVNRFDTIGRERVQGLPIYNAKLAVEAIDFQSCEGGQIGVLITPWFVNVMLFPDDATSWQFKELGEKVKFTLPSGEHEFTVGEEDAIGRYLFRSVVSPTHCYKSQPPARSAASKALSDLLVPAQNEEDTVDNNQPDTGRRAFLRRWSTT